MKKRGLILGVALILCFSGLIISVAEEGGQIEVSIKSLTPEKITYFVESTDTYENAVLAVALYEKGKMIDYEFNNIDIQCGTQSYTHSLSGSFDMAKVFLMDADTFIPICNAAKQAYKPIQIKFLDYDNTVLSTQEIYTGQSAALPQNPGRDGYIFVGWDKDTSICNDDMTVTAKYTPEDSDNIFLISSVSGTVGDTVTILLSLKGTVMLCGFDMRLCYDKDVLEFVSLDSELSMEVVANHVASSNSIRFNFSSKQNRKTGGDILSATFRIKETDAKSTVVRLQPISIIYANENEDLIPSSYITTEGEVFIS